MRNSFVRDSIPENIRVLQDVRKSGKIRDWKRFKEDSLELAKSYKRNGDYKKYERVKDCGGYLRFGECPSGHEKKLIAAKFCQVRLCPMCSARRSVLVFQNLREVIHEARRKERLEFIFLTLTAKSVHSDEVCNELNKYFEAWKKLAMRRPFKAAIRGWFRALEITHNWRKDWYHPHFHCLLAVKPGYFSGKSYIKHADWVRWWKESMGLDYDPVVDVRRVRPRRKESDIDGAIFETAKYSVKSSDYLIPESRISQDIAVEILDKALRNRRLVAYGGLLKQVRKELKQGDEEKHDLIKVGEDSGEGCTCSVCNALYQEVAYRWHIGYREYVQVESENGVGSLKEIQTKEGHWVDPETGEIIFSGDDDA